MKYYGFTCMYSGNIMDSGKLISYDNIIQDFQTDCSKTKLLMMLTSAILLQPTKGLKENYSLISQL